MGIRTISKMTLLFVGGMLTGCGASVPVLTQPASLPDAQVQFAQAAITHQLRDPDSAQFRNLTTYVMENGDQIVCGEINARNGFGGYSGYVTYYVRLQGQTIKRTHMDDATVHHPSSSVGFGVAYLACEKAANGTIPISASEMTPPDV